MIQWSSVCVEFDCSWHALVDWSGCLLLSVVSMAESVMGWSRQKLVKMGMKLGWPRCGQMKSGYDTLYLGGSGWLPRAYVACLTFSLSLFALRASLCNLFIALNTGHDNLHWSRWFQYAAAMISRLVLHTESFLVFWRWSENGVLGVWLIAMCSGWDTVVTSNSAIVTYCQTLCNCVAAVGITLGICYLHNLFCWIALLFMTLWNA